MSRFSSSVSIALPRPRPRHSLASATRTTQARSPPRRAAAAPTTTSPTVATTATPSSRSAPKISARPCTGRRSGLRDSSQTRTTWSRSSSWNSRTRGVDMRPVSHSPRLEPPKATRILAASLHDQPPRGPRRSGVYGTWGRGCAPPAPPPQRHDRPQAVGLPTPPFRSQRSLVRFKLAHPLREARLLLLRPRPHDYPVVEFVDHETPRRASPEQTTRHRWPPVGQVDDSPPSLMAPLVAEGARC